MNHVRVLAFGVLREVLGPEVPLTLPQGATVADLLAQLAGDYPGAALDRIAVSVNSAYASLATPLNDGDEIGLLPPVSGGSAAPAVAGSPVLTALTRQPIDAAGLASAARQDEDGAVVVFEGVVRNHTRGRRILHLDYEAYEGMAARQIAALAGEACARFGVRHVTLVHRLGRLEVGETSVVIAVASGHRGEAFDACRWLIDTLKKTVPVWKKETFEDGAVWAEGEPSPGAGDAHA